MLLKFALSCKVCTELYGNCLEAAYKVRTHEKPNGFFCSAFGMDDIWLTYEKLNTEIYNPANTDCEPKGF